MMQYKNTSNCLGRVIGKKMDKQFLSQFGGLRQDYVIICSDMRDDEQLCPDFQILFDKNMWHA